MKYAAHSLMWTPEFTEKDLHLFDKLKGMGFDGIEVHLNHPETLPVEKIKKKMEDTGMKCTFTATLEKKHNFLSSDSKKETKGSIS